MFIKKFLTIYIYIYILFTISEGGRFDVKFSLLKELDNAIELQSY